MLSSENIKHNRSLLPITTCNKFKILAEEEDHEMKLISDSIVREQLHELFDRTRTISKMFMPSCSLDNNTAGCVEATSMSDPNTLLIIHAGTNDVMDTRYKELQQKCKRMIQQYKSKPNKINLSPM